MKIKNQKLKIYLFAGFIIAGFILVMLYTPQIKYQKQKNIISEFNKPSLPDVNLSKTNQKEYEDIKSFTRQKAYEFAIANNLIGREKDSVTEVPKREFDIENVYGTDEFLFIKIGIPNHIDIGVQPEATDDYYTFYLLYFKNGVPVLVNNSDSGEFNPGMPFSLWGNRLDSDSWWGSFRQKKVSGEISFYKYRGDTSICFIDETHWNKETKQMEIGQEIKLTSKFGQEKCGLLNYFLGKNFESSESITFADIIDFALERGFVSLSDFKKIHDSNSVPWDLKKKNFVINEFKKINNIKFSLGEIVMRKLDIASCNTNSIPSLTLISPNGGEIYTLGDIMKTKWSYCNLPPTSTTTIDIQGFDFDSSGSFLGSQAEYPISNNEYNFELPRSSGMGSGHYKLKISCVLNTGKSCGVSGISEEPFIINRPNDVGPNISETLK